MIVRLVVWSLADSKTNLDELRQHLPGLQPPDSWISHEATERFGVIAFGELPAELDAIAELIGKDPEIGEEFDVEE